MYLSQLVPNLRTRPVQRALADCQEMHRVVMSAFPDVDGANGSARARLGVLYRIESHWNRVALLVQSHAEPDWSQLGGSFVLDCDVKRVDQSYSAIDAGSRLRFRLRANPTRKIDTKSGPDGRRNGKRVELRTEADWLAWLGRKAGQHGFQLKAVSSVATIPDVIAARLGKSVGRKRKDGPALTVFAVQFEGYLVVQDRDLFQAALRQGIGPAKPYGCGLLSVASG